MAKYGYENLELYQIAVKLWDLCWEDTGKFYHDPRGKEITGQLIRSVGSISANIEEGYGRGSSKNYANFLTYSRGSAQEARGWYRKSKFLMNQSDIDSRVADLELIIGKITKTIETLNGKS